MEVRTKKKGRRKDKQTAKEKNPEHKQQSKSIHVNYKMVHNLSNSGSDQTIKASVKTGSASQEHKATEREKVFFILLLLFSPVAAHLPRCGVGGKTAELGMRAQDRVSGIYNVENAFSFWLSHKHSGNIFLSWHEQDKLRPPFL